MGDIPITGDVVVIGGGLAGALIARHLAEARLSVVVLEASAVAQGATGRGSRVAFLGTPKSYLSLVEEAGEEKARLIWSTTQENLEEGQRWLEAMEIPFRRCGSLRLAATTEEAYQLQRSAAALSAIGISAEVEDATELGFVAAMRTWDDLCFDPAALTERLLAHPYITVEARTEVKSLEPRREDVLIWANGAYLRSHAVVIASGAYAVHLHPFLAHVLRVMPIQAIDCQAGEKVRFPLVWKEGQEVFVPPSSGAPARLIAWVRGVDEVVWPLLSDGIRLFCEPASPARLWASWVAEGRDGLPVIGEIPETNRLYALTGLGGWGLSWAFVAAQRLAALMLDGQEPQLLGMERWAM